jgi:hypothetical protein
MLTFYWNAFRIYDTGRIRRDYVAGMNTIAAIEASASNTASAGAFWHDVHRQMSVIGSSRLMPNLQTMPVVRNRAYLDAGRANGG